MAYSGQILENPVSGERFVFHLTAGDTGGDVLAFELEVTPDGHVPGAHVHPTQEERFEVVSGAMKFREGVRTIVAGPGDTVVVPPGTAHRFANVGPEPAVVRVEVRPALNMEQLYETTVALAREGRTFRSGLPRPLDLALFMREFEAEVQAPLAPGLVRAVMSPLGWLAARRGLDERYARLRAERGVRAPVPTRPGEGKTAGARPGPTRSARPGTRGPGPRLDPEEGPTQRWRYRGRVMTTGPGRLEDSGLKGAADENGERAKNGVRITGHDGCRPRGRCPRDRDPVGIGSRVPDISAPGDRHPVGRRLVRLAGPVAVGTWRGSVPGPIRVCWFPHQPHRTEQSVRRSRNECRDRPRGPGNRCAHGDDRWRDRNASQLPETGSGSR